MPSKPSFDEAFTAQVASQYKGMGDAVASQMGGADDTRAYSEADQLKMWNASPYAAPDERVRVMLQMRQQGASNEDITDHVYPDRRRMIVASRPDLSEQIKYAQQMDRLMARQARDAGIHFPHDETWAKITEPNAPTPQDTQASSAQGPTPPESAGPASAPAGSLRTPAGAPTPTPPPAAPGWAQGTGSMF